MNTVKLSRRDLLIQGGAALVGLAWLLGSRQALAFPRWAGAEVIPWLDQPPANPMPQVVGNLLQWEQLDSWLTPNDKFFTVGHYNKPSLDEKHWALEVTGLVKRPLRFTLQELKTRPRQEVIVTLECSGNHGFPWFLGGIGFKSLSNAIDTTTPEGMFIYHISSSFAELERDLSRERTMAGLRAARARGRKGGRRPRLTPDQARLAAKMLDDPTNRVNDILAVFHVPRSTLYRAAQPFRKHTSAEEPTHAQ